MTLRRHSARKRKWTGTTFACALVLGVGALECAAADEKSSAPPAEDAITAAKRDFEAVKSARNPALQQKGELPRIAVPELSTGAPAVSPIAPKSREPEKKSANWLLEAMEKQQPRNERDRDRLDRKSERGSPGETLDGNRSDEPAESSRRDQSAQDPQGEKEKREAEALNPLTRYLGEWMTPQDYALLKPGLQDSLANTGVGAGSQGTNPLAFPMPGSVGSEVNTLANETTLRGAMAAAPRENPYLDLLNTAPAAAMPAAVLPAPPATTFSAPLPSVAAPPPSTVPAKPRIPEFARPAQDEKYFKQLKRF